MNNLAVDNFEADPTSSQPTVSAWREDEQEPALPSPEEVPGFELVQKEQGLQFAVTSNTITSEMIRLDAWVRDSIEFYCQPMSSARQAHIHRFRVGFPHAVITAWQLHQVDPRQVGESIASWLRLRAPHHHAPTTQPEEPSPLAQSFLQGMKVNADQEIQNHLSAGRSVHGLRNGHLVTIKATK